MKNKLTLLLLSFIFLFVTTTFARTIETCFNSMAGHSDSILDFCNPQKQNDCIYPRNGGYINLEFVSIYRGFESQIKFSKIKTNETKTCKYEDRDIWQTCKNPFGSAPTKVTIYPEEDEIQMFSIECNGRCNVLLDKKICI